MGADEGLEARVGEAGRPREEALMPNEDNQARWVDPSIFLLDTPRQDAFSQAPAPDSGQAGADETDQVVSQPASVLAAEHYFRAFFMTRPMLVRLVLLVNCRYRYL